jgi:hypothetical protein
MNDRNGRQLHDRVLVDFQYSADSPVHRGRVVDCTSHRAKELNAAIVQFAEGGGHPQFIASNLLTVVEENSDGN